MKMVQAILRPEKIKDVEDALKEKNFNALTEISVRGRGRQKGIVIGNMRYDKLPKEMLIIACKEQDLKTVLSIIQKNAWTGNVGDGKIFVLPIEQTITIRSAQEGQKEL